MMCFKWIGYLTLIIYSPWMVANDITIIDVSQIPANTVPQNQPISFTVKTTNVDDGINDPSQIGVGILGTYRRAGQRLFSR